MIINLMQIKWSNQAKNDMEITEILLLPPIYTTMKHFFLN